MVIPYPSIAGLRDLLFPLHVALRPDGVKKLSQYDHKVQYTNDLIVPNDQLLPNTIFEQDVDRVIYFVVFC